LALFCAASWKQLMSDTLFCGIDVGSTTVKIALMASETKKVLATWYIRHNACQAETVQKLLGEVFSRYCGREFRAAVCGSGGKPIADALGAPFIQEVVANTLAVRHCYPKARVAIELGGQDAKIIFFYYDEGSRRLTASDMRMNGSCAGGTGAFIDEVASLLQIPVEEFEGLASKGSSVYDISGRCGVFAKTDIQPLLNQGGLKENVALSAFHAIAKQTIGGLAQGLPIKPPVVFEGGPFTFNPTLIRVFQERLGLSEDDTIRPERPETLVAWGAALSLDEMFSDYHGKLEPEAALAALGAYQEDIHTRTSVPKRVYFASAEERREFEARHQLPPLPSLKVQPRGALCGYI
jgi:predicted CoA-substrate-specific enzyme activase